MDLSPRHLEHQVYIPTAITLSRLNPQPARSPIYSRKETFNSLKSKEIDNAQTKARHVILRSRIEENEDPHLCQCQGNVCTCRNLGKNTELQIDEIKPAKAEKLAKKDSNQKTKASFNVAIGKGESNMRIRQVNRLVNQICDCIKEIEDTSSIKTITKEFITPYELQRKNKRLDDYLNSGRRTLFTLKREIKHLECHVSLKKNDCKWLRILSTVSRTLYQLLLGLKNLTDSVLNNSVGLVFYEELLHTSWRLFYVASTVGIKFSKQDIFKKLDSQFSKVENIDMDKPPTPTTHYESSIDTSSDLLHSCLDEKSLALLQPSNIRRQIAALARVSLPNKKKKVNESDIKILAPLSLNEMIEEHEPKLKKYVKRQTKKNLKRSGSHQRGISHSSDNDQIEIVPEKRKNISPTRLSFISNNMEPKFSEIINQKDISNHHIMEEREKQINSAKHQEHVSPETLMTQIQYLNERVCKINEDWEETEKKIYEIRSHTHEEDPKVTHQLILNEAQCLLRELHIEAPKFSSSEYQNEKCVIFEQENNHFPRTKYPNNPLMNQNSLKNGNTFRSNTEKKDLYMQKKHYENLQDSTLYLSLNTIQDQVRTEKEQFWAALVKRGVVAVDHKIPVETKVITDLSDHTEEKGNGKDVSLERQMEQIYINSQIKDGKIKNDLPINTGTLNKKVQTNLFKEKVKYLIEKETQVGSGISKSYSTSFVTETGCSNTYENETKPSGTTEHRVLSNDDIENLTNNSSGEQIQRNSELYSLNESSFNSEDSNSNESELSNKYHQSNFSDESTI